MSFNISLLKGIHKVTKAPERVWVGNLWSIEVPVGFTYTVDPEKAGSGAQGTYQLHIQSSKDCDFDAPYSSVFNVVVYGMMHIINRNSDDMGDEGMLQALDDLSSHVFGDYQLYKCSRDLVVYYEAFEESEEYTAYNFQVMTRGSALVFNGQFNQGNGYYRSWNQNQYSSWFSCRDKSGCYWGKSEAGNCSEKLFTFSRSYGSACSAFSIACRK